MFLLPQILSSHFLYPQPKEDQLRFINLLHFSDQCLWKIYRHDTFFILCLVTLLHAWTEFPRTREMQTIVQLCSLQILLSIVLVQKRLVCDLDKLKKEYPRLVQLFQWGSFDLHVTVNWHFLGGGMYFAWVDNFHHAIRKRHKARSYFKKIQNIHGARAIIFFFWWTKIVLWHCTFQERHHFDLWYLDMCRSDLCC